MTNARTSPFYAQYERKDRRQAQITQKGVHPTGNAKVARRCAATGAGLRRALQQRPAEQRTGYITPKDMLAGRQQEIHAERDRKLEQALKQRRIRRHQAA